MGKLVLLWAQRYFNCSLFAIIINIKKVQKEYANHYGCLVQDEHSHELLHYAEKPETFVSDLINCGMFLCLLTFNRALQAFVNNLNLGVYIFSPKFFDIIGKIMDEVKASDVNNMKYHTYVQHSSPASN